VFHLIDPACSPAVALAEDGLARERATGAPPELRITEIDAAFATVRRDYGRVSRWLLGLLGTAGAAVGALAATGALGISLSRAWGPGDLAFIGALAAIGVTISACSVWLLVALHRSGRRLARAAGYWAALPYLSGRRQPVAGDYFAIRFHLLYTPDLLIRTVTATLALLAAVFTVSSVFFALLVAHDAATAVLMVAWSILAIGVGCGQFGGILRYQLGYGVRDPLLFERRVERARRRREGAGRRG
jgi:hypothetical protein